MEKLLYQFVENLAPFFIKALKYYGISVQIARALLYILAVFYIVLERIV